MAVPYPEPGTSDAVCARMSAMAESMAGTPGLLEGDAGKRRANTTVHAGESRPREYFHLIKPD
jgi:hypothetical protein